MKISERDGRFVITARASYSDEDKRQLSLTKVHRIPEFQEQLLFPEHKESENELSCCDPDTSKRKKHDKKKSKQKNEKKHSKKKKFKNKKDTKKMNRRISNNLTERNEKNGNLMAELLKKAYHLTMVDGCLWSYNNKTGCFDSNNVDSVSIKLRSLLGEDDRNKISSQEYREAYNQLMISEELISEKDFFANKPFVNCKNGVVDVLNGELLPHESSYRFKHCIMANYDPNARCKKFLEYVDIITKGDEELKKLFQTVLGYLMSHYNNAKTAFLLYGPSNTGKSVILNIIERVIGTDYISHADLIKLKEQEYAAELSGKLINIAPDLDNAALKNVGFFKSLISHNDTIAARRLYSNPTNVKGETKMIFATNHLLSFDSSLNIGDIEAVFNRFIYIPFQNKPFIGENDNHNASEDIANSEIDGIFTWAMKGLKRYLKNNENFPFSKLSEKIKEKNIVQFCPEKSFFYECIELDEDSCELTQVVKEAYESYCSKNKITSRGNIQNYLKHQLNIKTEKKRIDELGKKLPSNANSRWSYVGIRLKDKYRP